MAIRDTISERFKGFSFRIRSREANDTGADIYLLECSSTGKSPWHTMSGPDGPHLYTTPEGAEAEVKSLNEWSQEPIGYEDL